MIFFPLDDRDIEKMGDVSDWFDTECPCCKTPVKCRITNLQMVARTGDETLAGREYMPVPKLKFD